MMCRPMDSSGNRFSGSVRQACSPLTPQEAGAFQPIVRITSLLFIVSMFSHAFRALCSA